MQKPIDQYPQPLVPEHLTSLTIEKLPLEVPYYVSPGEQDEFEELVLFVTDDRHLKMSKSHALKPSDASPSSPVGLVPVMRVPVIDAERQTVSEAYVADLRFIENHQLVDTKGVLAGMDDQEEFMAWLATIEDSVDFAAFIALEDDDEISKNIPSGAFYGDPGLYPFLEQLRKKSDGTMKKVLKRQAKNEDVVKSKEKQKNTAKNDQPQ